jgi:iron complex outermembrane receptor protein
LLKQDYFSRMKRNLLLSLGLLFCGLFLSAQEIGGILFDKQTGEPLINASVVIKGTTQGAVTDIDGKFKFRTDMKPPFTLVFSYIGYESYEMPVSGEDIFKKQLTVRLNISEVVKEEVVIVDSRITEKQKESPLTIESMGLQAIKQTASQTFYEGLGTLKGVDMQSASLGFVVINTRGFNSTSPVRSLQLLDGADNQAPGLNFSIGNFAGATDIDIQKVDLIVGASSPLYGPNAFNGVINLQTKNPFYYPGLSVMVKGAERNLFEGALRYARAFKNKNGTDKFAFKVNFSYLRANDWQANSSAAADNSRAGLSNPGGYDAVNRYGDEQEFNYDSRFNNRLFPGLKSYYRTGYMERDLVDYNISNLKANTALHYRITQDIEARVAYNFGYGTTVYQGDNRYSLRGLQFHHLRAEVIKPDKFYLRAYATFENAGQSYDAVFTAFKLQDLRMSNADWASEYQQAWTPFLQKVRSLPGYPDPNNPLFTDLWFNNYDSINNVANQVLSLYNDSLSLWHSEARKLADQSPVRGLSRLEPGTAEFDSLKNVITSRTAFEEGGTRFYDKSKMFHVQGEYKWDLKRKKAEKPWMDLLTGASFRLYLPDSRGTIFSDTMMRTFGTDANGNTIVTDSSRRRITNWQVGAYVSANKKLFNDRLIITATLRMDKNQNFPVLFTPAASLVWSEKNHTIRLSFSSAIRNPTLQDQYLYYNVGRAILVGNLNGFDSLVTVSSLQEAIGNDDPKRLQYFNAPAVRPEKARTLEIGYKGILFKNKVYLDGSAFVTFYKDFIGYRIGANLYSIQTPWRFQVFRVATNSPDRIMSYGAALGFSYFFINNYALTGNYTWNVLNRLGSTDELIPAFNTPEHKFNIGINGRDIKIKSVKGFGFNVNYKWIQGFIFEGSPQFTGRIPSYSLLDAQISWEYSKIYTTFKLGASNIISRMNTQVYGGPAIGRMIYGTVLVDLKDLF